MGWFWASSTATSSTSSATSKCPIDLKSAAAAPSGCPIDHKSLAAASKASSSGASACPVDHTKFKMGSSPNTDSVEVLNPMNNMPDNLSSEMAPGQKITLSKVRTISTIPKGESDSEGLWEYPSPQQMLNAMLRKGKAKDIPEDAVESMVDVHNFLNEGAWQQILEWEEKYTKDSQIEPRLLKFIGKPHELSPRAKMYLALAKVFPDTFNSQPPFDRHDWTVLRKTSADSDWKQVRYVIDYYSAPDDEDSGMPAFMLDTRPALDSLEAGVDRFTHWSVPLWEKAMGKTDI